MVTGQYTKYTSSLNTSFFYTDPFICVQDTLDRMISTGKQSIDLVMLLVISLVRFLFAAIKTGRYTHQKRTNDTIEIKQGYMTPSAVTSQSSTGSQNSQSSPEGSTSSADKPVDLSSGACSLPSIPKPLQQAISPLQTPESSEQGELLKQLSDAWRACFKDTTCMFEQKEFVDSLVHDMMKANNMQCLDHIITYNGHSATEEELKCIKKITEQVGQNLDQV